MKLLISSNHLDSQTQLNIISDECSKDRALINPIKTEALLLNLQPIQLMYNDEEVPISDSPKHLGLNLNPKAVTSEAAISKSRKTIYALMGAEVHGKNGINPTVSRRIWERYNVPRSSHGLDIQIFNKVEIEKLQNHENQFMQQFQTLPSFAPTILAHILIGGRPITNLIHRKMLGLLMNIRRKNGIEAQIGRRQLAMKKPSSQSWFWRVNKIANLYGLPNALDVMEELPWDKETWKNTVKKAVAESQLHQWKTKLSSLSSLNMINPDAITYGNPHPVWLSAGYSCHTVKMAISKVRFLTDTLMTGVKLHTMFQTNPTCACGYPWEDRYHLLLDCELYKDLRTYCTKMIIGSIQCNHPNISTGTITDRTVLIHLILDPTWYRSDIGSSFKIMANVLSAEEANFIETIGRTFCFKIYKRRFQYLSRNDPSDSDDETTTCYSFIITITHAYAAIVSAFTTPQIQ